MRISDVISDVCSSDLAETVGRGYIARAGELGDRLLAGIDDVGVDLGAAGVGPEAEHAVFRLERHIHAGGNIIGDPRWTADTKIYVEHRAQFAGRPGRPVFLGTGHVKPSPPRRPPP